MNNKTKFTTIGKKRNSPFKMGYKVYGNGEEKVLFIMGILSRGKNWNSSVEYYKNNPKYSCCIYDHVGIGESEYSSVSSVEDLASDALELIEHLKWDKTNVIGMSMGSLIAYELSIIAPHRIKTLNLSSITSNIENWYGMFTSDGVQRLLRIELDSLLHNIDSSILISNLMFSQSFLESDSRIKNGKNKEFVIPLTKKLSNELSSTPINVKVSHILAMINYRIKSAASTTTATSDKYLTNPRPFPIVMFFSTKDPFIDWKTVIKTYEYIQPNLIYFCKDAGHAIYSEDPLTYNQKCENFFSYKTNNDIANFGNPKDNYLKQEVLEFNSKTILKDHYSHLAYKKTPIHKLPLFVNYFKKLKEKTNYGNNNLLSPQKVINNILFTLLKKIK